MPCQKNPALALNSETVRRKTAAIHASSKIHSFMKWGRKVTILPRIDQTSKLEWVGAYFSGKGLLSLLCIGCRDAVDV